MDDTSDASDNFSQSVHGKRDQGKRRETREWGTTSPRASLRSLDPVRQMTYERSLQAANVSQAQDTQWGVSPHASSSQPFSYAPVGQWYGLGSSASMTGGGIPSGEQSRSAAPPLPYRPFSAVPSHYPEVPDVPVSKMDLESQRQELGEMAKKQVKAAVRNVHTRVQKDEKSRLDKLGKEVRKNINIIAANNKKGKAPERSLEELLKAACKQTEMDLETRKMTSDTKASKLSLLRKVERAFPIRTQGGEGSNNQTERDYRDTTHDKDFIEGDSATSSPKQFELLRQDYNTLLHRTLPENLSIYKKTYRGLVKMYKNQERTEIKYSVSDVLDELNELVNHMRIDLEIRENEKTYTEYHKSYGKLIRKVSEDNKERYENELSRIGEDCMKYINEAKICARYDERTNEEYIVNIDERKQKRDHMITSMKEFAEVIGNMINDARDEQKHKNGVEARIYKIRDYNKVDKRRNISIMDYNVDGEEGSEWACSGRKFYPGATSGPINNPYFEAISIEGYSRNLDTEYILLNRQAEKFNPAKVKISAASGYTDLHTEREPCPSCWEVIRQYREMFPNITLRVSWGEGGD